MKRETEILNLITARAEKDAHVRAVLLGGSHRGPKGKPDCFPHYDVVYLVDDLNPFAKEPGWVNCFGEMMIQRTVKPNPTGGTMENEKIILQMQFMDGNQIDLGLLAMEAAKGKGVWDARAKVLLDKDGVLSVPPEATEEEAPVPTPTSDAFSKCCNEFWWLSTSVAKDLWRWEIPSAKAVMDGPMRAQLMTMLEWSADIPKQAENDREQRGRRLQNRLDKPTWIRLLKTYSDGEREHIWESLNVMDELFRTSGGRVAQAHGFGYPSEIDEKVTGYLRQVRSLPCDAKEVFPEKKTENPLLALTHRVSSAVLLNFSPE